MILRNLWVAASLLPFALGDVKFTGPAAGDSITGLSISITWEESGDTPKISELASYQLFLCAGGNDVANYIQLATLVTTGDFTTGNSATGTLTAGLGANVQDAYFIKMISAATGGSIVNFSDRFSLPSMIGVFPASVTAGLKTISGTSGPATINEIVNPQNGAGANPAVPAAGTGEFAVPYSMQTGEIRYAPMAPQPVTKITAKNPSAQYPTSAVVIYTTYGAPPNAITTNTQPGTFSVSSREATGAAAGQPSDSAMQKFLNRWKD